MADHKLVEASPEEMENAQKLWDSFIQTSKWSIALIAVVLLGLTFAFVPFG